MRQAGRLSPFDIDASYYGMDPYIKRSLSFFPPFCVQHSLLTYVLRANLLTKNGPYKPLVLPSKTIWTRITTMVKLNFFLYTSIIYQYDTRIMLSIKQTFPQSNRTTFFQTRVLKAFTAIDKNYTIIYMFLCLFCLSLMF